MLERIEKELNGLAKRLNIETEEMTEKYNELASNSGLDLEDERQQLMAMSMTPICAKSSFICPFKQQPNLRELVTGFFVGIEPVRDIMEYKRKSVLSRYNADSSQTLTDELVAEIMLEDGEFKRLKLRTAMKRSYPPSSRSLLKSTEKLGLFPLMQFALGNRATPTKTTVSPFPRTTSS